MNVVTSFLNAVNKGLQATNERLDAFNDSMSKKQRVSTAVAGLERAVTLERFYIDSAIERAEMNCKRDQDLQDPIYRQAYEEAERLLKSDTTEPLCSLEPLGPAPIPDFSYSISPQDGDIRTQIEERVAELRSSRAAFLGAARARLTADPDLRRHFESVLASRDHSQLLAGLALPSRPVGG